MVNHLNRKKSVSALMKQAYTHADGGKISVAMPTPGTFHAHTYLSNATATLRFTAEMKANGRSDISLAELTEEINRKLEAPCAHASGKSPEEAIENLIQRIAAGLTT